MVDSRVVDGPVLHNCKDWYTNAVARWFPFNTRQYSFIPIVFG